MNKKLKTVVGLVAIAGVAAGLYLYSTRYNVEKGPQPIKTTGTVEGIETNVAAKVAGKLLTVNFREGDRVKAGELIATIEGDDIEAELRQSEAALNAARTSLSSGFDAVENARAQYKVQTAQEATTEADIERAAAQLRQAETDLGRFKELFSRGIISKSDLDNAQTLRDTRGADLTKARASLTLDKTRSKAAMSALKQSEGETATLRARISEADANVAIQKARLTYTKIYSPSDAVVEYRTMEPGEVVSPGASILTLVDMKDLWVRIDVEEGDLPKVKVGYRAEVTLERAPGKVIEGYIFDIGREAEFAVERDVNRGRQDIRGFRVRIRVKDPDGVLKPGMTTLVSIPVK